MNYTALITVILLLFNHAILFGQETTPVKNYKPSDYSAENQNWSVSQSVDKKIYVANSKGLLEFNGGAWKLYPTANESIMRSVTVVENTVYTGSYMDFGYWEKDDFGQLQYKSLSNLLGAELIEDEEFWNIIAIDDWILFQSLDRIYIYSITDNSIETIESTNKINKMFEVDGNIYFQRVNNGIYRLENGKDVLFLDDDNIKEKVIVNIFKEGNKLLIQTRDNGFFVFNGKELKKWISKPDEILSNIHVYNSLRLRNGGFVLGTISNGLIYLDEFGHLELQVNKKNGLFNNTVLALLEDIDGNIWSGLDNGISLIDLDSPYKVFKDYKGQIGSVYTSALYMDNLYLGSNQGLFYRKLDSNDNFTLVENTQGQVWCLKEFDKTLFMGHDSGTYTVFNGSVSKIADVEGTWDIDTHKTENLLIQGNYDGMYILEKKDGIWGIKNKIEGFNNSSRNFVEMPNNEIFINHEYKGVFKVKVDKDYEQAIDVSIDSLMKGDDSNIVEYNNDLLFSNKEGVFKYNALENRFMKDSILNKLYTTKEGFISGKLLYNKNSSNLWSFASSKISLITPGGLSSSPNIKRLPFDSEIRHDVVGYESALKLSSNKYLFGNYSGYYTIDIDNLDIKNFRVGISEIVIHKRNDGYFSRFLNKNLKGNFEPKENTFEFSFFSPEYYNYMNTEYQYQLTGIYNEWSDWSITSKQLFENLPYGDYIFKVRSKIGNQISKNIASYSFSISKPWYISNLLITIYIIAFLSFSLFMHNAYKWYYNKLRNSLIEHNQSELRLAEVQSEKEIMRIKNEQLSIEFKSKSKELAAATMGIIRKNELLNTIKNELNKIAEKSLIKPVISVIDKNLKKNDDWEFFQEAFNNADSEFLKNIKALHPKLSPNDLKLCAYLRLNLSSKEIAPLLNISPRSVEIKRYRLRKKMNLSHEDNLVNYIIEL